MGADPGVLVPGLRGAAGGRGGAARLPAGLQLPAGPGHLLSRLARAAAARPAGVRRQDARRRPELARGMTKALDGLLVVDLTVEFWGSLAAALLGDFGA